MRFTDEISDSMKTYGDNSITNTMSGVKKVSGEFPEWNQYIRNNEASKFFASSFKKQRTGSSPANENKSVKFCQYEEDLRNPKVEFEEVDRSKTLDKEDLQVNVNYLMG